MGACLKVLIPKSDFSHLESSYPSCPAQFAMSIFLRKPRQCSGLNRVLKPTILGMVAALVGWISGQRETLGPEDPDLRRLDAADGCEKLSLMPWRRNQVWILATGNMNI